MPSWTAILIDGAVLSSALGVVILGSLAYNSRLWLNDAPRRVRELSPSLTPRERRERNVVAAIFLVTIVGATIWSSDRLLARHGEMLSFANALAHFLGVFFLFNVFDLLVIDYLVLLVLRPAFLARLAVAGLTYEETVGGYGYHFAAFIKGMAFIVTFSLLAAGLSIWAMRSISRL